MRAFIFVYIIEVVHQHAQNARRMLSFKNWARSRVQTERDLLVTYPVIDIHDLRHVRVEEQVNSHLSQQLHPLKLIDHTSIHYT